MAILSDGPPVLLNVAQAPTFADAQAAITWSSGVTVGLKTDFKMKNLIGRGSGESIQLAFQGQGWALIQPSEGRIVPVAGGSSRRRAREPAQRLRRPSDMDDLVLGVGVVHGLLARRGTTSAPRAPCRTTACRSGSPPPALRAPQSASSRSAPPARGLSR